MILFGIDISLFSYPEVSIPNFVAVFINLSYSLESLVIIVLISL